jgi:MinD-like ATPase involved in chromosome partitioning or flagellar assembly
MSKLLFTMGGKGGVGKTTTLTTLIDYYKSNAIPVQLYDCDMGNKTVGSLSHYFDDCKKLDIRNGQLDDLADAVLDDPDALVVADMPAGADAEFFNWFDLMAPELSKEGVEFVGIASITTFRASIITLYEWANQLQDRAKYLVCKNHAAGSDFGLFDETKEGQAFCKHYKPAIVDIEGRRSIIQAELEDRGLTPYTLQNIAAGEDLGDVLKKKSQQILIRGYFNRCNEAYKAVADLVI